MKTIAAIATGAVLAAVVIILTGCSLTVAPDGTCEYRTDEGMFLKAVQIIAEK